MSNMVKKKWYKEFASTLKEWHYIVSSFFTGAILGFFLAIYVMLRMLRRLRS